MGDDARRAPSARRTSAVLRLAGRLAARHEVRSRFVPLGEGLLHVQLRAPEATMPFVEDLLAAWLARMPVAGP